MDAILGQLLATAKNKGVCAEGYERMSASDRSALIDYYLEMPDWCLERSFPDLHTLSAHFADCEDKGIYVKKVFHGELLNDLQTYVFHKCSGTIKVGLNVEKAIIPMLYLANGCKLRIVGVGDIKPKTPIGVPIYTFGKNDFRARDNKYVRFTHYKSELI